VDLEPENPAAYSDLSHTLARAGQVAEARAELTSAMARLPDAAADPRTGLQYDAACYAARMGDRPAAYDGIAGSLAAWTKLLAKDPAKNTPQLRLRVGHWLEDADLTSVRDPQAL